MVATSQRLEVNLRVLTKICILTVVVGELVNRSVYVDEVCVREGVLDEESCESVVDGRERELMERARRSL